MQELPKFHETFIPILEILNNGEVLHYNDLRKRVRDKYYSDLPDELLNRRTKNGDLIILNRVGWGKSYLKQAKYIRYPERAMVQITDKGKKALELGKLTIQDIKNDPDYLAYQESRRVEKESENEDLNNENASPEELIDSGIAAIEDQVKSDLLDKLKSIDPYYFERVILRLLQAMGYGDFIETKKSNDGGIDGVINQDKLGVEKIYMQAKRYNENKVREKDIRNFIGAMSGDTSKGVFVTTSAFDVSAVEKARNAHHSIILIDGLKLVDLMHQYNVGVQVQSVYEVKQVDEDFFEGN